MRVFASALLLHLVFVQWANAQNVQGIVPYMTPLFEKKSGNGYTYSIKEGVNDFQRNVGMMLQINVPGQTDAVTKWCPNLLPINLYTNTSNGGQQVVLPYDSKDPNLKLVQLLGHGVRYRGDCNAWRQIEVKIQTAPIPSIDPPELKFPRVRFCEEQMYPSWAFYQETDQPKIWFTF
ncbi:hypothetical protein M3Y99_01016100 [Aphelenchoides fujianensis]|nr:hypothetical protein M3Y99_01016100 [Aphelenchoides fujianensis]